MSIGAIRTRRSPPISAGVTAGLCLGLFLLAGSAGCNTAPEPAGSDIVLEYDSIAGYEPVLEYEGRALRDAFELSELTVEEKGSPIAVVQLDGALDDSDLAGTSGSLEPITEPSFCTKLIEERDSDGQERKYRDACLSPYEIGQILRSNEDQRPSLDSECGSPWQCWYAHGLAVPCCSGYLRGNLHCEGYGGFIWLGGAGATRQSREEFVTIECGQPSRDDRMKTGIHELGHVLNLHHAEYDHDWKDKGSEAGYQFTDWTRSHLVDHPEEYVRPGKRGMEWCIVDPDRHKKYMHDESGSSGIDACVTGCEIEPNPEVSQKTELTLDLETPPEDRAYVPCEPVRARVRLKKRRGGLLGLYYRSESSLDPYLGSLHLDLLGPGESCSGLKPVIFADPPNPLKPPKQVLLPGATVTSPAIDLWYMMPQSTLCDSAALSEASFRATLVGLQDDSRTDWQKEALVIQSTVQSIGGPLLVAPDYDEEAKEKFALPEARKFLFFMGGDDLVEGKEALETVSRSYPESVYAPYANLALGVNLSLPFRSYKPSQGAIVERIPDYEKARGYLDKANQKLNILPGSYRVTLHQARALTYKKLAERAEAAGNTQEAINLYDTARKDLTVLAAWQGLPFPLSLEERRVRERSQSERAHVSDKIAQLVAHF